MPSTFPGAIDSFTDPLSNSSLASPSHSTLHSDINDAVEKVEQYMGLVKVIPTAATNGTINATTGTVTIGNAVSSVSVTCFSALYDNYKIIVSGGTASTTAAVQFTLGAAATGYYVAAYGYSYAGAIQTDAISNGSFWRVGRATAEQIAVNMEIFQPFTSDETWFNSNLIGVHTTGNWMGFGGYLANTTSYNAFTLTPASGTLTGGTIRVYGYRN